MSETSRVSIQGVGVGVGVAADGRVYGAAQGSGEIVVVLPGFGVTDVLSTGVHSGPKGVAFDAKGRVYAINHHSQDVAVFEPGGAVDTFGGGTLVSPYAYSADMTAYNTTCLGGHFAEWTSGPIPGPSDDTVWLDASWTWSGPSGATLLASWRVAGAQDWQPLEPGGLLGLVAAAVELRAVLVGLNDGSPLPPVDFTLNVVP